MQQDRNTVKIKRDIPKVTSYVIASERASIRIAVLINLKHRPIYLYSAFCGYHHMTFDKFQTWSLSSFKIKLITIWRLFFWSLRSRVVSAMSVSEGWSMVAVLELSAVGPSTRKKISLSAYSLAAEVIMTIQFAYMRHLVAERQS